MAAGGSEGRVPELLVPGACGEFTADRGSGASGHRADAGTGGKVSGRGDRAGVADDQEYRRCGLDADSRHGHQGLGKREVIEKFFDFFGRDGALVLEFPDVRRDAGDDQFDGFATGHGDGRLSQ